MSQIKKIVVIHIADINLMLRFIKNAYTNRRPKSPM